MNINKAINLELKPGRYDGSGNIYFETSWLTIGTIKLGLAAQIEILETLFDSLNLSESDNEKNAFNFILEMMYEQENKRKKHAAAS